jgi:NDP-hexose-3-ketoreductase
MTAARVRFGVVGCADIAWRRMLPAMAADRGVELVAVASRDPAKAERFAGYFRCEAVDGYRTLLDRADVDAVYLPLPAMLHAEWIERALLAGKHVFAEKPMTTDAADAERLVGLARDRGLVLYENYGFLHHAQHTWVDEMLEAGVIGDLRSLTAVFAIPPKPAADIRYDPAVGGGALFDIGVYPIRIATRFLGPDLDVVGAVLRMDRDRGVVVSGSAHLCRPDGVAAQLGFGMEHGYRNHYELSGSLGRLWLDRAFTPPDSLQPIVWVERQDHIEQWTRPADAQFSNAVRFFVEAVQRGDVLLDHGHDAVHQARLVGKVDAQARRMLTDGSALHDGAHRPRQAPRTEERTETP